MLKGFGTDRSFWKLKISAGCLKVPDVSLPKVADAAQYLSCAQARKCVRKACHTHFWPAVKLLVVITEYWPIPCLACAVAVQCLSLTLQGVRMRGSSRLLLLP